MGTLHRIAVAAMCMGVHVCTADAAPQQACAARQCMHCLGVRACLLTAAAHAEGEGARARALLLVALPSTASALGRVCFSSRGGGPFFFHGKEWAYEEEMGLPLERKWASPTKRCLVGFVTNPTRLLATWKGSNSHVTDM